MSVTAYIHEFSIKFGVDASDNDYWRYQEYTNLQFHNSTLNSIPVSIEKAIFESQFFVHSKSALQTSPSVVGRVILDNDEAGIHWSVVAIMTYSSLPDGSGHANYRFFLCQGNDKLDIIVHWLENYQLKNGNLPSYNSSQKSVEHKIHKHTISKVSIYAIEPDLDKRIRYQTQSLLLSPKKGYDIGYINFIAAQKAQYLNQTIAWAFNISQPYYINQFQVIHFSSKQSFQSFQSFCLTPVTKVVYQSLLSQLKHIFEKNIRDEIIHQLKLGNIPGVVYPGTPVSGSSETGVQLRVNSFTREELINLYNNNSEKLLQIANDASLTEKSLKQLAESIDIQSEKIILRNKSGGRYWIVFSSSDTVPLTTAWLMPTPNLKLNSYYYERVMDKIFEYKGYVAEENQKINLIKPAKVKLLSDCQSWLFLEKGILLWFKN